VILLAPTSSGRAWDLILGKFGPDVEGLEDSLDYVFGQCLIDSRHIAIGGFSDGASYALSLGVANGDLFTHVIGFSPGFIAPPSFRGKPQIYVSHGIHDSVLPISKCSRRIIPTLEGKGYVVHYHEFDGYHSIPKYIASEAVSWFLG